MPKIKGTCNFVGETNTMMKTILSLFICLFFSLSSIACDEASITFISEADNGDGTFTYTFDLCIEFLGIEGSPDWFALEFSGGSYTSISSFTPPTLTTTTGDNYNGAVNGNTVQWTCPTLFPSNGSPNFCNIVSITTNGQIGQVHVFYHDTYPSSACEEILTFPIACSIDGLSVSSQSACDPATNTYSQEVLITYTSAPSTGNINVNGQTFPISSSPQTVTLTNLPADGNGVGVTAFFSDDPFCTYTDNLLFIAPQDCTPCSIDNVTISTQTSCDPTTDTYDQVITITYTSPPSVGSIDVNGQIFPITSSPQSINLVGLSADGNPVDLTIGFTNDPACNSFITNAFTAPPSCSTPCNPNNGTWN